MILFLEDLEKVPYAVVDTKCPNDSFWKYSFLLKSMGIKNHLWPVMILDADLLDVDPFDPDLTQEMQVRVALECKYNPFYYFRRVARAPGSTIEAPLFFLANRSNMTLLWLFFNHITTCLLQPRQTGKTLSVCELDVYLLNIRSVGGRTLLLTKDESLRAKTLSDIKKIEELLPWYLKQHGKNDIGNREEINVSNLDNNYKAFIARNDPIAADKTGRGHTVENTRIDEAAYLFYIDVVLKAMLPGTTAARERADLRDMPYGNIFTTTAGKKDERDGAYMYDYFHNSAAWTEFFLDCKNAEELKSAVRAASKDGKFLRVHASFNHRQLGKTDKWLRETASENNSDGEAFERDYLNIWTSGSQNSPFSVADAKRIRESESEVLFGEISRFNQIMVRWYIKEDQIQHVMANTYTILSLDTSDGQGRDDIAVNIKSLKTGEVFAACTINEINLITVANFLVDFLKRYDKMTFIPERRNQAATIIDFMILQMLAVGMDPFRRIFNFIVQDHVAEPDRYKEIQNPRNYSNENFLAQNKKYFGFTTSGHGVTSRSELYGTTMRAAVKYTGDVVRDKPTIGQLLALVIKDGRVDHPKGGHDDMCIAWLLGYWFMASGKNLGYYGVPENYVLSTNQVANSSSNKEEVYQNEMNRRARYYIEKTMEMIKAERDQNVIDRLIFEIENVKNILGPDNEVTLTANAMINQIKKDRSAKYYGKRPLF